MQIRHCLSSTFLVCLIFTALISVSGCGHFEGASEPEQVQSPQPEVEKKPVAVYHDFEDVLVPEDLTIIKDRTVVVSTPGFRSGILTLKGRLEPNSLYHFFSINMEKDNWDVLSRIKAPETTIMVFQKATRCAVITIREQQIYTYVEIGIAPTLGSISQTPTNDAIY
ncbi:hypothetical protein [Desulfobacter latus]|uniref:Lipoprotein n=1 Tax=Desulfobacter latus TaxID=2292 RepID=A0A850TB75_9BACT|nr:hypothetical protein [Desulfobacter latus]NWH04626.1 hypothetical protein [Desulfobacter latus]